MKKTSFAAELVLLVLSVSILPILKTVSFATPLKVLTAVLLAVCYFCILLRNGSKINGEKRLRRINRGANQILLGGFAALCETVIIFLWWNGGVFTKIFAVLIPVIEIGLLILTGVVRTASGSKQIKAADYILMMLFWYVPIVNIFLVRKFYKTARREFIFESDRAEIENSRAASHICSTKYPILMVHGIFFRDWQLLNYWGRIPAALIRNGADVHYGNQQSSRSVAESGAEVRDAIMKVISETGAEKVNIIAHSKGGLDSRYAISCLGMDKYVATLTTINTPHKGCDMVDYLLDKMPEGIVRFVAKRYNKIFTVLGDTAPNFLTGVNDLSAVRAKSYDKLMPDMPDVSYRSFMSVMSSTGSAAFPLNLGYTLIKKLNGRNDGLVWEESARHGESFKTIESPKKRGISHGDVIDLMRENIEGYDVREFYVQVVAELKKQGY